MIIFAECIERIYETMNRNFPNVNTKIKSEDSVFYIVITINDSLSIKIHAISRYVMRVKFLNEYTFDWIIDDLNDDDELDLFFSQIQRLTQALVQEKFREHGLWLKNKNKCIGRELEIHFDPLEANDVTVFKSKVSFVDRAMARLVGIERRPTSNKQTEDSKKIAK